jgi:hypothetical protein
MKYKLPQFNSIKEMAYIDVCRLTEDEARNILEQIRCDLSPIFSPEFMLV